MPLKLMTLHRYFLPTYIISVLTKTYIDMTNNESILDGCKGLVMHCDCSVLILNVMGEHRIYLVEIGRAHV